ncbi:hypothetical protein [Neisseria chenwenguii]|uniref:Uncharacterized protein n=1 Tax=Neisseria chenwenguii TaxID=1853278 RepID=A0A220S015_9NEIS|nr:hypothetical protein [Neisseria chenwenguii]ASK26821.1 hypothetical protein BG910_02865 [Neisseria chenwenguii]ROV56799.1 hypothetical protein EGS38_02880 [Neisseria chenwenguii]
MKLPRTLLFPLFFLLPLQAAAVSPAPRPHPDTRLAVHGTDFCMSADNPNATLSSVSFSEPPTAAVFQTARLADRPAACVPLNILQPEQPYRLNFHIASKSTDNAEIWSEETFCLRKDKGRLKIVRADFSQKGGVCTDTAWQSAVPADFAEEPTGFSVWAAWGIAAVMAAALAASAASVWSWLCKRKKRRGI